MPSEYGTDSLPAPSDDRVTFEQVGSQRLAALRYSGRWSQGVHDRHVRDLRDILRQAGLFPVGEPMWARYDPPWKPWFLRRNEVLLAVDG
jgi:hypothetical protein